MEFHGGMKLGWDWHGVSWNWHGVGLELTWNFIEFHGLGMELACAGMEFHGIGMELAWSSHEISWNWYGIGIEFDLAWFYHWPVLTRSSVILIRLQLSPVLPRTCSIRFGAIPNVLICEYLNPPSGV